MTAFLLRDGHSRSGGSAVRCHASTSEAMCLALMAQRMNRDVEARARLSSCGRPVRCGNAANDTPKALIVDLPPRSLGHNAGERSAVLRCASTINGTLSVNSLAQQANSSH